LPQRDRVFRLGLLRSADVNLTMPPHAVNTLLGSSCPGFFDEVGKALPDLLKPTGAAKQTPSGSKQATTHTATTRSNPAAVGTDAVKDLQQVLLQDGDYQGPINGVYDPETKAAYQKYVTKHPVGSAPGQPSGQGHPPAQGQPR
jgi:hypothetical protein